MAQSETDICNDALAALGQSKFIADLNEASQAARLCNRFYSKMRDATLRDYPWQFALAEAALAEVDETVKHWDYAYRYPTDCVFARSIMTDTRASEVVGGGSTIPFEVMADSKRHGKLIVTDEPDATLAYTAQITDPYAFDALFAQALSWRIAWALSMPLTKEPDLGKYALDNYKIAIAQARAASISERERDERPESELVTTRY